ncbi:dihydrofolate reductase family protein [Xanthomonas campestris pv. merremiae]|uniref:RibD family protein n=1 Tax=Xanthomonas citri TaxID=346 RepID=UPI001931CF46|nr:dihydrofolate reductase family protein [Xanthomonas citri]MBV6839606.1 dihydrofolate reductase family protein [Xanthomonas campestris pv. merremiae]MCC8565641.1 dihydrofolate reductase family protein [Xanthomonas citri pv. fuscans]
MRPHVICHMMSGLDGKTDPDAISQFGDPDIYEQTHPKLCGDAWLCGRVTLQVNYGQFAEQEEFINDGTDAIGQPAVYVAGKFGSYALSADRQGRIKWKTALCDNDHVVVLTTERASAAYLGLMKDRGVSYIVAGKDTIDFASAFAILGSQFGIKKLIVEGGGTINGAVLDAGLIDEFSLLLMPGVDGRRQPSASFDGRPESPIACVPASLQSIERLDDDVLWLRYQLRNR